MRLFELDFRAVAVFDFNNAIIFVSGQWQPATIYTTRKALTDGSEMTVEQFKELFPLAAASLSKVDYGEPSAKLS